jgi:type IV fimbrial biogenesis protein FimT
MRKSGGLIQAIVQPAKAVVGLRVPFRRLTSSTQGRLPYRSGMVSAFNNVPLSEHARDARGLTLIELVVTIAISGILLAVAVPSYTNFVATNRLSTTANAIVQSLQEARMQAIKLNQDTQFSTNGAANILNADGTLGDVIQDALSLAPGVTLSSVQAVTYGGQGLAQAVGGSTPYTGLIADVYTNSISTDNHRCIYMTTGSTLSSCVYTQAGAGCPANEPTDCQQ